jgi:hypothetical protein
MSPSELHPQKGWPKPGDWPQDAYAALECNVAPLQLGDQTFVYSAVARDIKRPSYFVSLEVDGIIYDKSPGAKQIKEFIQSFAGKGTIVKGRLRCKSTLPSGQVSSFAFIVDSHRLCAPSVAGMVIGLMGCALFGLYLRRWLRERKALASEPPGDMIA